MASDFVHFFDRDIEIRSIPNRTLCGLYDSASRFYDKSLVVSSVDCVACLRERVLNQMGEIADFQSQVAELRHHLNPRR